MTCIPIKFPIYTSETHPFRGRVFKGFPPCTYYIDGKRYCPTSWCLSHAETHTFAVLNTRQECEDLVRSWGATVEWQSDTSVMAIAQDILAWMKEDNYEHAADILVRWINYLKCVQETAASQQANLQKALEDEKKSHAQTRERIGQLRRALI